MPSSLLLYKMVSPQLFLIRSPAQLATCQIADMCLTADPGVGSLIPVGSHTFEEIDDEIILWSFSSLLLIQEGLLSVTSESMCMKYWLIA